tara:strand:+ start:350 stop:808 length:459 start_codon:yes stop_codon:yes gene_type:complete
MRFLEIVRRYFRGLMPSTQEDDASGSNSRNTTSSRSTEEVANTRSTRVSLTRESVTKDAVDNMVKLARSSSTLRSAKELQGMSAISNQGMGAISNQGMGAISQALSKEDMEKMTVKNLKEVAKLNQVRNYSNLKKDDLIKLLDKAKVTRVLE